MRWSPLELLFYVSGRAKTYTQSAVITLEILLVTMEAFVFLLNGLPGHSLGALDCAESIFKLFPILLAAPVGVGWRGREGVLLAKDISGGQLLLIVSFIVSYNMRALAVCP